MNQKYAGVAIIIIALYFSYFVYDTYQSNLEQIRDRVKTNDTCFSDKGECLHEKASNSYLIGGLISFSLLLLGIYLTFIDKTQKELAEHQVKVSQALKESKEKDEFKAYLSGFKEDEQKVIKAVHEQDGIQQSTLRYRTAMSKTSLSLLLKDLEKRQIITRESSGKTNKIHLVKKF